VKRTRVIGTEKTQIVTEHGELINEEIRVIQKPKDRKFAKIYLDSIERVADLTNPEKTLLLHLLKEAQWNSNYVKVTAELTGNIAKEMGCSTKNLSNTISSMVKKNVIKRLGRGEYMINPDLVFVGTEENNYHTFKRYFDENTD